MAIVQPLKPPRTDDPKEQRKFLEALALSASYISGTGDPTGSVAPRWYGDRYYDAVAKAWYWSAGLTSADWATVDVSIDVAADIADFGITASKLWLSVPVVLGLTLTNNSPTAGKVAWSECDLYLNGVKYDIAAGNSDKKYIYFKDLSATLAESDTNPSELSDWAPQEDFVIAVNLSGTGQQAWSGIANQVIGNAFIESLSGVKIQATSSVAIGNTTFGADGIQLQYNSGNPRFYAGNGATDGTGRFILFDGSDLTIKGTITALSGSDVSTVADMTPTRPDYAALAFALTFDEPLVSKVNDAVGGLSGTMSGTSFNYASFSQGISGLGLNFVRANSTRVAFASAGVLADLGNWPTVGTFSISFWMKHSGALNNDEMIFSKYADGNNYIELKAPSSGSYIKFIAKTMNGATEVFTDVNFTDKNPFDNEWHHVCLVVASSSSVMLYMDGSASTVVGTIDAYHVTNGFHNTGDFRIGGRSDSLGFTGMIDEFYYFTDNLTAAQMKSLRYYPGYKSTGKTLIDGGYIRTDFLTASNILTGYLAADRIEAGTITAGKIVTGDLTFTQLASGAVTTTAKSSGVQTCTTSVTKVGSDNILLVVRGRAYAGTWSGSEGSSYCSPASITVRLYRGSNSSGTLLAASEVGLSCVDGEAVIAYIDTPTGTGSQSYFADVSAEGSIKLNIVNLRR